MKSLFITLVALFMGSQAFALNANSSWSEILTAHNYKVNTPAIPGGLFNLCYNGKKLQTIKPVTSCDQYKDVFVGSPREGHWERVCVSKTTKNLSFSLNYKAKTCVQWGYEGTPRRDATPVCLEEKLVNKVWPLAYNLEVELDNAQRGWEYAFTKNYSIPSCH